MGTERASTGRFILYLIVLFCFETRSCYALLSSVHNKGRYGDRSELGAGFQDRASTSGWVRVEGLDHNRVSGFVAGARGKHKVLGTNWCMAHR